MSAVILNPETFSRVKLHVRLEDLEDPRARDLYQALEEAFVRGTKETGSILALINDDAAKRFVLAVAASGELEKEPERIVNDGIRAVRIRVCERDTMRVVVEIGRISAGESEEQNGEEERQAAIHSLLQKKMKIDEEIAQLKGEVDE